MFCHIHRENVPQKKLYSGAKVSNLHRELFRFETFRKLRMIRVLRIIFLSLASFHSKSSLIPSESKLSASDWVCLLPPVAYLHFLTFLCHYHLHNIRNYQELLGDLCLTIEEDYCIWNLLTKL